MGIRRSPHPSYVKPGPGTQVDWGHYLSQNLIGCWLFNEGGGFIARDATGIHSPGTIPSGCSWTQGKFGPALTGFSGTSGVSMADNSWNHTVTEYTIAAWISMPNPVVATYQWLLGKDTVNDNYNWLVLNGQMDSRPNGSTDYIATSSLVANTWTFVAITVIRGAIQHYNNGRTDGTGTFVGGPTSIDGLPLVIGNTTGFSAPFNGSIDHLRFYNRGLSQAEIQKLYAEPFAGLYLPRRKIGIGLPPVVKVPKLMTMGCG